MLSSLLCRLLEASYVNYMDWSLVSSSSLLIMAAVILLVLPPLQLSPITATISSPDPCSLENNSCPQEVTCKNSKRSGVIAHSTRTCILLRGQFVKLTLCQRGKDNGTQKYYWSNPVRHCSSIPYVDNNSEGWGWYLVHMCC